MLNVIGFLGFSKIFSFFFVILFVSSRIFVSFILLLWFLLFA
jgi:hypothetical protein